MVKILVVDDEPVIRYLTRKILEEAEYEVVEAEDGEEGLEILETEIPDLILLDIMLPGIDGWDVCEWIKAHGNLKDIPIAMFTVKGKNEDISELLKYNPDAYITKPFDSENLLETVGNLLEMDISLRHEKYVLCETA